MAGEHCRTGCRTRDHGSYGECARAADIRSFFLGGTSASWGDEKRFRKTNEDFRTAVSYGLMPAGVSNGAIRRAYEQAEKG
jgi:hypothetical protein